ncbi:hypothetical protein I6E50_07330 [Roseburia hominis]|uniref:hypothetical protein n=1 Tax=Roseburia hominis TaxID=301301 RepID=UPI001F221081|nr:hypothetical protein [Roseburia hominis]
MGKVLHIKDAYFKIPDKCKDDFGCAITMLGVYLQRNDMKLDKMNQAYEDTERVSDFLMNDEQKCLLSCSVEENFKEEK